jgi:anti-sigma B factor antagonist
MMDIFSCTVDTDDRRAVVYLNGELDQSTVNSLIDRLRPLAEAGQDVLVDFSALTFCGTAGIAALAEVERHTTEAGGSMRLSKLPAPLWRVLSVTGMRDRFTVVDRTGAAGIRLHRGANQHRARR